MEVNELIAKQYPFLSRNREWVQEKKTEIIKEEIKKLEAAREKAISEEFLQQGLESQLMVYQEFMKFKTELNYDEDQESIFQTISNDLNLTEPTFRFNIFRVHLRNSKKIEKVNGYYQFPPEDYKDINSLMCLWKIRAWFFRYYYYSLNISETLFDCFWLGSFGLRTLYGLTPFYTRYSLTNGTTGSI